MEAAAYQQILALTGGPAFAVREGRLALCTPQAGELGLKDGAPFAECFPGAELPGAGEPAVISSCRLAGQSWQLRAAAAEGTVLCFLCPEERFLPAANARTVAHTAGAIRTVLQDLTTSLNSLAELPAAAEQPFAGCAAEALRSVYRLRRTAAALEQFARLQGGSYAPRWGRLELTMAMNELGGQLRELLAATGLSLELRIPARPLEACLDWPLTASLLRELTANAAANAGDGRVTLELSAEGPDRVRFTLRNRPGAPLPEALFHRHAARRDEGFGGLGLGLSLVSAGAACQGGSFLISADAEGEVTALLSLPRYGGEAELCFESRRSLDPEENLIALSPILPARLYRLEDLL